MSERYTVVVDMTQHDFAVIDHVRGGEIIHARFWRREDADEYADWKNSQPDAANPPPISWYADELARVKWRWPIEEHTGEDRLALDPEAGAYDYSDGEPIPQERRKTDSSCEGCGVAVDEKHLSDCPVWLEVLAQD